MLFDTLRILFQEETEDIRELACLQKKQLIVGSLLHLLKCSFLIVFLALAPSARIYCPRHPRETDY